VFGFYQKSAILFSVLLNFYSIPYSYSFTSNDCCRYHPDPQLPIWSYRYQKVILLDYILPRSFYLLFDFDGFWYFSDWSYTIFMPIKYDASVFSCSQINHFELSANSASNSIISQLNKACWLIMQLEDFQGLMSKFILFVKWKESAWSWYQCFNGIKINSKSWWNCWQNEGWISTSSASECWMPQFNQLVVSKINVCRFFCCSHRLKNF